GATLAFGLAPFVLDGLVDAAASSLVPGAPPVHLAIWHGFTLALGLSLAVYVVGGLMFLARKPTSDLLATGRRVPSGSDAYLASLRGLNKCADRVTGLTQNGSLPFYIAVILLTVILSPGIALLLRAAPPTLPDLVDGPGTLVVAAAVIGGALGAA